MTLNQPAGHLELDESLIDAVIRETNEETAWQFEPTQLIGIYRWQPQKSSDTYLRFCFTGKVYNHNPSQVLDVDIHQAIWLTFEQITMRKNELRSPLVLDCLTDYLAGHRYPLSLLHN